ncbi:MAG: sugar ABC transporter substrate-binding protein [Candidatus Bipolaricaulaceae bacterium]
MKKLAWLVGCVLALSVVGMAAEPGKLIIWADDTRTPVFDELGKAYTDATGIPVEVVELAYEDIRGQFVTAAPTGEGPDIIIGAHDWIGELAANGLLAELELAAEVTAKFDAVSLEAFTYGALYGIPYAREGIALVYNKNLVTDPPATWEGLLTLARELTDPTTPQYGFVVQNPDPYHSFPFMSALGGYIFGTDAEGKLAPCDVGLDNAGAVAGYQLFDQLFEEGLIPAGLDWNTWTGLFADGRIAMVITGPWAIGIANQAGVEVGVAPIPSLPAPAEPWPPAGTELPVIPDPDAPGHFVPKPFVGVQGVMVSAFSPNLAIAQDFLVNYFVSKDTMLELYERDPRIPTYLPAYEEVQDDPILAGFADSIANATPMPNIPEMAAVWGAWTDALELIANQSVEPAEGMPQAADAVREALECE